MANNRYRDMQAAGERARQVRQNLTAHPMSPREAAELICGVHIVASGPKGFGIDFGRPPDFAKVDGEQYWQAWRVLQAFARGDG